MTRKYNQHLQNLVIIFVGVLLAIFLVSQPTFHSFLAHLGKLGYFGAFIAGILFTSGLTISTSILILFELSLNLSPWEVGLIGGLGAVIGDLFIFHIIKDDLSTELEELLGLYDHKHYYRKLLHSKYARFLLPLIGALVIISPLPDELGISLMGFSQMTTKKFILISYVCNTLGILLIVTTAVIVKSL